VNLILLGYGHSIIVGGTIGDNPVIDIKCSDDPHNRPQDDTVSIEEFEAFDATNRVRLAFANKEAVENFLALIRILLDA